MISHRYTLEPLPDVKLNRKRKEAKQCPCGKSNKDGKFVPFEDFTNRGYCHSCGLTFGVAANDCPSCKKQKVFSRYIDTEQSNAYLDNNTGKCLHCSYHQTPTQFFERTGQEKAVKTRSNKSETKTGKINPIQVSLSLIDTKILKQSRTNYHQNNFVQWLNILFSNDIVNNLVSRYHLGTSKHWPGATVFWQIDTQGKIRSGKIMLYNPTTGKRVKEPFNHITWVHKALKLPEYQLRQCFFGEHLLKLEPTKPVAIVESEKTAIIASVYFPQFIWLAAGSKEGLTQEKCKVLSGRNVILFPDLNSFEQWTNKTKEISLPIQFTVSDLLERKATIEEKKQGLDLADYLIRFDWKLFKTQATDVQYIQNELIPDFTPTAKGEKGEKSEVLKTNYFSCQEELPAVEESKLARKEIELLWNISELENYFRNIHLPTQPIKIDSGIVIKDTTTFIQVHLSFVKNNNGYASYLPYLHRLQKLKQYLSHS